MLIQAFPISAKYKISPLGIDVTVNMRRAGNEIFCDAQIKAKSLLAKVFARKIKISSQALYTHNYKMIPLEYHYTVHRRPDDERSYQFHWKQGYIRALYRKKKFNIPLKEGTVDPNFLYLRLMQDVADNGQQFDQIYHIISRGKLKERRFFFAKEEMLQTPVGTFKTLKILRKKRNRADQALWLSPQHAYLPLKIATIRDGKERYTAMIARLSLGHKER